MSQRVVRILLVVLAGMMITLGVSGCRGKKQDQQAEEKQIKPGSH
ncbi:hypothetical protein [Paenibacillus sp. TH7-28]